MVEFLNALARDRWRVRRRKKQSPSGGVLVVSFLDAAPGYTYEEYEERWARTTTRVASLMEIPPDNAALYRNTAFALTPDAAASLRFDP